MNTSKFDQFSQLITNERQIALARLEDLERDLEAIKDATADSPDDEHDPEGATVGFERARVMALRDETLMLLAELDAAGERLEHDRFGTCAACANAISFDRLEALPTATLCIGCAAKSPRATS